MGVRGEGATRTSKTKAERLASVGLGIARTKEVSAPMSRRTKRRRLPRTTHPVLVPDASGYLQRFLALSLVRGHARADTPLDPLELAPSCWRELDQWLVWVLARHPKIGYPRRVLVDWQTFAELNGAAPARQGSLRLAVASCWAAGLGGDQGGVAFVYADPDRNPTKAPRRVTFFRLDPPPGSEGERP